MINFASTPKNVDIDVTACQGTAIHNPFRGFEAVDPIAPGLSTQNEIYVYVRSKHAFQALLRHAQTISSFLKSNSHSSDGGTVANMPVWPFLTDTREGACVL